MKFLKIAICGLCVLACAGAGFGQARTAAPPPVSALPPQPGGTVPGHVYCADTQRPARFADVEVLTQVDLSRQGQGQNAPRGPMYQSVGREDGGSAPRAFRLDSRGRQPNNDVKRYQSATQAVTVADGDVRVDAVQLSEVQPAASSTPSTQ
jgi:hypothetical protein